MTIVDNIAELIHRRRRQILVNAIIYYNFNENIIDDFTYDAWSRELASLQRNHPHISELVHYHSEAFKNFTPAGAGFGLPLNDPRANAVALSLLNHRKKHGGKFPVPQGTPLTQEEIGRGWLKYHLAQEPHPPRKVSADI